MTQAHRPHRILVVDDEELLRWSICTCLEEAGFDVLEAGSVSEGVEVAIGPLDAAVVDYRLPDATGIELVAALRRTYPDLHVVMMTAYRTAGLAALAERAGIDLVLDKPFVVKGLLRRIREALSGRSGTSECAR
ncbi:MAG: response regulator [Proteobacteria bacterium]|nr:response regulator [Pseudomonadota bacterium]